MKNIHRIDGKIYITNVEKIKEGDWMLDTIQIGLQPIELATKESIFLLNTPEQGWKKIILTTDQDLIADGVQAIDDEFLEWFVNNPSCEFVEIDNRLKISSTQKGFVMDNPNYKKIITPKEQQKQHLIDMMRSDEELGLYDEQETLEEVAVMYAHESFIWPLNKQGEKQSIPAGQSVPPRYTKHQKIAIKHFIAGAKWQQQQNKNLYSEYEVYRKLHNLMTSIKLDGLVINDDMDLKKWFEQNKNK